MFQTCPRVDVSLRPCIFRCEFQGGSGSARVAAAAAGEFRGKPETHYPESCILPVWLFQGRSSLSHHSSVALGKSKSAIRQLEQHCTL